MTLTLNEEATERARERHAEGVKALHDAFGYDPDEAAKRRAANKSQPKPFGHRKRRAKAKAARLARKVNR